MNDPIFSQMKEQLIPSPAARAALEEGLSRPVRRPVHRCRYWVLAACLLLAAALPLGHALLFPPLHSYVTVGEAAGQEQDASTQEAAPRPGLIISESGLGPDTLPAEEGEPYDLSRLPASAQDGVCPAQQLPSAEGETSSDADTGEGALLLERLTREIQREYGNGTYPDWYGGGYLDSAGDVVVLLVRGCDTQALRSQVRDWAGGGVSFARARYSLASLTKLQEQICAQPSVKAVLSSCALDEENNRLVLSLTRADDEALSALAVLDPRDDAVYVQAAAPASAESGTGTACPRASTAGEPLCDADIGHRAQPDRRKNSSSWPLSMVTTTLEENPMVMVELDRPPYAQQPHEDQQDPNQDGGCGHQHLRQQSFHTHSCLLP